MLVEFTGLNWVRVTLTGGESRLLRQYFTALV